MKEIRRGKEKEGRGKDRRNGRRERIRYEKCDTIWVGSEEEGDERKRKLTPLQQNTHFSSLHFTVVHFTVVY